MTVANLIAMLSQLPQDSLVVMASDAEGNDYGPLCDISLGKYLPYDGCSGEVHDKDDLRDFQNRVACVTLWPVN